MVKIAFSQLTVGDEFVASPFWMALILERRNFWSGMNPTLDAYFNLLKR
jgi:hypothetical protein